MKAFPIKHLVHFHLWFYSCLPTKWRGIKKLQISENVNVNFQVDSFNYETLSRKCSPTNELSEMFNSGKAKPVSKWVGPLEPEKSVKLQRPMDDQCALDLHKSKSYIVDLIDRALSKELGTVPRDQTVSCLK